MQRTLIHERVEQCRAGTYEKLIGRVSSGWVVAGDVQFLRGYCLIYPDPVVPHLNALSSKQRKNLMHEAATIGDALLDLTSAVRINYEILGNLAPALHFHIFPRYIDEPNELVTKPVWFYDWETAPVFDLSRDQKWMKEIYQYLVTKGLIHL